MKVLNKLFGVALAFVSTGMIASCSSDNVSEPENTTGKENLVSFIKAPEVAIYSGSMDLYGTRAEEVEEGEVQEVVIPDEVEVNLAVNHTHEIVVNDEEGNPTEEVEDINDLVTKLSIHVRHGNDVKIRIPVPAQYVVPADDMAIVLSHQTVDEVWKEDAKKNMTEYVFEELGKTVKLYIDFYTSPAAEGEDFAEAASADYAQGYICVWTEGIDDELIEYLYGKYGDGINFEIYNYYNQELGKESLDSHLNKSTVDFLGSNPDVYVNAFMRDLVNDSECVDHFVYITGDSALGNWGEQADARAQYDDYTVGSHQNGSDFNHIYTKKTVVEDKEEEVEPAE